MMKINQEETRRLVEIEQDFDSGKVKFVLLGGNRVALPDSAIEALGLKPNQTINAEIFKAMIEHQKSVVVTDLARQKAQLAKEA